MRCAVVVGLLMFQFRVAFRGRKAVLVFHNGFFLTHIIFFPLIKFLQFFYSICFILFLFLPMEASPTSTVALTLSARRKMCPFGLKTLYCFFIPFFFLFDIYFHFFFIFSVKKTLFDGCKLFPNDIKWWLFLVLLGAKQKVFFISIFKLFLAFEIMNKFMQIQYPHQDSHL